MTVGRRLRGIEADVSDAIAGDMVMDGSTVSASSGPSRFRRIHGTLVTLSPGDVVISISGEAFLDGSRRLGEHGRTDDGPQEAFDARHDEWLCRRAS